MFFQGKCVADFLKKKQKCFLFLKKKVCNALSLEKHAESAKGTGKGTGRELGKRKGTGKTQHFVHAEEKELEKHGIFDHTRERELEKHGIFNRTRERELEKHSIFNHAQEREQQQQEQEQKQPGAWFTARVFWHFLKSLYDDLHVYLLVFAGLLKQSSSCLVTKCG